MSFVCPILTNNSNAYNVNNGVGNNRINSRIISPNNANYSNVGTSVYFFKTRDHTHVCNAGISGTIGRYFCV